MVTDVKLEQPEKADNPILVTELGIETEVKPVQLEKADDPILVTELGIETEIKPVQPEKADDPILVTELGIETEVKPVQPEKADDPILVTKYVFPLYTTFEGIVRLPVGPGNVRLPMKGATTSTLLVLLIMLK